MNDWLEAEQRVERAQRLTESEKWGEALAELDAALAINPNNATWHAQRGMLLEELERWEEASEAFETSRSLDPSDPEVSVALGQMLVRSERLAKALAVYDQLAQRYPDYEPAYCFRIHILSELGRHEQAEEMFYLAQELDESCPRCFMYMGGSLAARGEFERAIYCWERVLELDADSFGVNRRIGQAYRSQGDLETARDYFLREMRDDPGNTDLLFELADMMLESGQVAMAAAKLTHILELDPDHVRANYALGKIWMLRGQMDKAQEHLLAADTLSTGNTRPSGLDILLGENFFQLGQFDESQECLTRALERSPVHIEAHIIRGNCLLATDKPEKAADSFRRVLAVEANHAFAHHQLGVSLYRTGDYRAGLSHCREALRIKPDFSAALSTSAIGHLRLGEWRNARKMLRKALQYDPQNADLQRLLKRLWWFRIRRVARRAFGWIRQNTT